MQGIGTLVNIGAIVVGTGVGLLFGRAIPARVKTTAMSAIGLAVLGVGLQMAIDPRVDATKLAHATGGPFQPNPLVVIGGLVVGAIAGELLQLERRLERFGAWMQSLAPRSPAPTSPGAPQGGHDLVEGFVTASLLYCVGAMAVIGAIQDAAGQPEVLFVKALLDGIASVVSVLPLAAYQGGITAAASVVAGHLTVPVLATLTSAGGLLIAAIGLDLTGIKRLPVGNLLPGVFAAAVLAYLVS